MDLIFLSFIGYCKWRF